MAEQSINPQPQVVDVYLGHLNDVDKQCNREHFTELYASANLKPVFHDKTLAETYGESAYFKGLTHGCLIGILGTSIGALCGIFVMHSMLTKNKK